MTTVLVAARQPQSQKRYRSLLGPAGVEAQFVTNVDLLIKCVKSRPIDLVVFDVDDPSLPVRRWLDAAREDGDLGLVPVLWVGTRASRDDLAALKVYRPGIYIAQTTDAETILGAVQALAGSMRQGAEINPSASQPVKSSTWMPAVDTIDDALSIFTDPTKEKKSSVVLRDVPLQTGPGQSGTLKPATAKGVMDKDPGEDYDWFVTEMVKAETAPANLRPDPSFNGFGAAGGDVRTSEAELPAGLPAPVEASVPPSEYLGVPMSGSSTSESETLAEADKDLVDRIAKEVTCQLAIDLLKSLDQDTIRRAVEAALEKSR